MLSISKITVRVLDINESGKPSPRATLEVDQWRQPEITILRMADDLALLVGSDENDVVKANIREQISNIYHRGLPRGYANSSIISALKLRGGEYTVLANDGKTYRLTFDVLYRRVELGKSEGLSK